LEKPPIPGDPFRRMNRRSRKSRLRAAALNNPKGFFDRLERRRIFLRRSFCSPDRFFNGRALPDFSRACYNNCNVCACLQARSMRENPALGREN